MRIHALALAALLALPPAPGDAFEGPPPAAPVARIGTCPSGYAASGGYCNPGPRATYAVPRARGATCPSGYASSGDYCLAGARGRLAVPRSGTCPSGFSASGDYCLSAR